MCHMIVSLTSEVDIAFPIGCQNSKSSFNTRNVSGDPPVPDLGGPIGILFQIVILTDKCKDKDIQVLLYQ